MTRHLAFKLWLPMCEAVFMLLWWCVHEEDGLDNLDVFWIMHNLLIVLGTIDVSPGLSRVGFSLPD